jgi:cytoskeletal protein CcmA (bactofilin family)
MFGGNDKASRSAGNGTTLLARSIEVTGDIRFEGHLEVEGRVVGDIYAREGSNARVRVLENGVVEGHIHAPNVVINGQVIGDVHATKHLELAAHAVVNGNVHYQVVEMVKGAQVNGNLMHVSDAGEDGGKQKRKPMQLSDQSGHAKVDAKADADAKQPG